MPGPSAYELAVAPRVRPRFNRRGPLRENPRVAVEALRLWSIARINDANPVLALTVIWAGPASDEILIGRRNPAAQRKHPLTPSVPTRRLSWASLAGLLMGTRARPGSSSREVFFDPRFGHTGRDTLDEAIDGLMAEKLGAREGQPIPYQAHLSSLTFGQVLHKGEDGEIDPKLAEPTVMANAVVVVPRRDVFPPATESYDPLVWMPIEQFFDLIDKDPEVSLRFFPELGLYQPCAEGMCVSTTARIARRGMVAIRADVAEAAIPPEPFASDPIFVPGTQLSDGAGEALAEILLRGDVPSRALLFGMTRDEQIRDFCLGLVRSAQRNLGSASDNLDTLREVFARLSEQGQLRYEDPALESAVRATLGVQAELLRSSRSTTVA